MPTGARPQSSARHRRARAAPATSPPSPPSSSWDALCAGVRLSVLLVGLAPAVALAAGERNMHCRTDADCRDMFPGSVDYVCCFQLSCNDKIRYFKEYSGCSPKRKCPEKAKHNQLAGLGMHFATRLHLSNYTLHKTAVDRGSSGQLCEQLMRSVRAQGVPVVNGKTGKVDEMEIEKPAESTSKKPAKPTGATGFASGIKIGRPPNGGGAIAKPGPTHTGGLSATAVPDARPPVGSCAAKRCLRGERCCVRVNCDLGLGVADARQWYVDDYCARGTECPFTKDVGKPRRRPDLEQYYMSPAQWAKRKDAVLRKKYLYGDVERDCTEMDVFFTALHLQRST